MQKILNASLIYRILAAVGRWFGKQWQKSIVVKWLTSSGEKVKTDSSIFASVWMKLRSLWASFFRVLRLDRLFENSIFKMPFLWCLLTVFFAPILPTKLVILLVLVSFASLAVCCGCDGERKLDRSPVNKYILIYAAVYAAATCASVTFRGSVYGGAVTVLFVLFSIVIQGAVKSRRQLDLLLYAIAVSGTIVALYGIYQYIFGVTGSAAWLDDDMFSDIATRVYSTLQNPNVLSEYLLLTIPLAFALIITDGKPLKRIFFAGCTAVMCLCLVLTYSRGGWLGLIFGMAIFLVMLDRRFILVGIVGLIALYFVLPETIISRFASIGDMGDSSTSYRVYIWMGSLAMIKDYWLCGIGPGTEAFNKVYPLYSYNAIIAPHSHNLFLQIACDSGICGIVVFVLMLISMLRVLATAVKNEADRDSRILQTSFIASLAAFLVQSATDYSFYNYRVMLMFWGFIGLSVLVSRRSSLPEAAE